MDVKAHELIHSPQSMDCHQNELVDEKETVKKRRGYNGRK